MSQQSRHKSTGKMSVAGTQLSFNHQKSKGQAINVNGKLTPTASLKAVLSRTANQQTINLKSPTPNGAAILAAKKLKGKKGRKWYESNTIKSGK